MEERFQTWDDVYKHVMWNIDMVETIMKPFVPINVKVPELPDGEPIYGYDWPKKAEVDQRIDSFIKGIRHYWYTSNFQPLNKGTLCTVEMLTEAKTEQERLAIWIYAFIKEFGAGKASRELEMVIWQYLDKHNILWYHHAMKKLVPLAIPHTLLWDDRIFDLKENVLALALLNAYLVATQYQPILYFSSEKDLKGGEKDD